MKNTQRGFAPILAIMIIVVLIAGGIYYFSQKSEIKPDAQDKVTNSSDWNTQEITNNGKSLRASNIPPILVQKDTVFQAGRDAEFKDVKFSPDGTKVAFAVKNASHDFGWVYDFTTSKFIPLSFQYGGGVDVISWKNNNEVTLKLTTPKPSTSEVTFNLNALPEYPKVATIDDMMPDAWKIIKISEGNCSKGRECVVDLTGTITVTGQGSENDMFGFCFKATDMSDPHLPATPASGIRTMFCFNNQSEAAAALKGKGEKTIRIKDYKIQYVGTEKSDMTTFVEVMN
jgi:hypothetical protein